MGRQRVLCAAVLLVLTQPALARTTRDFPYGYDPVWSTLVRFIRVDEGLKVVEKDPKTGYVLFELTEGKRTFSGAAELMKVDGGGTRVIVRITDRPSYMELGLLERLGDKLRAELGDPPKSEAKEDKEEKEEPAEKAEKTAKDEEK